MQTRSLFDELSQLWIKVQPDEREPHQWIYAVDDAWFHPEGTTVQIAKNGGSVNLIPCKPIFDSPISQRFFLPGKVPFKLSPRAGESSISVDPLTHQPDPAAAFGDAERGDRGVADRLIAFIQEQANNGLRYGVCFCSFEYVWKHIAEIDAPQNAVFFDIRHALGWNGSDIQRGGNSLDVGVLRDNWKDCIESTELFGTADANAIMVRLGWYLHYSLKFARILSQKGSRCSVHSNHIQIVSSAVNPDSERSDALSDYSVVQQAIWAKLPEDDGVTPDLFAFSPMPKDEAMKTGLGVFNNSFRHAAKWQRIKTWFLEDIFMVYSIVANGHLLGTDAKSAGWKWKSFQPNQVKDVSDPLYKTYDEPWIKINDLLRMLSHSGVSYFPLRWQGFDDMEVRLPTTPGFLFVMLLNEFINNLDPKGERNAPTVDYKLTKDNGRSRFHLEVLLKNDGVKGLWDCYTVGKKPNGDNCGSASKALRALASNLKEETLLYEICAKNEKGGAMTVETLLKQCGLSIQLDDQSPEISKLNDDCLIITLPARTL